MEQGVSVAVPVYNSEATLPGLVAELEATLQAVGPYEIVLVDDRSTDGSWSVICDLAAQIPAVRGLRLSANSGEQCAVLCGIGAARLATIITMDDDLQHPPASIPALLAALDDGAELAYGVPDHDRHAAGRRLAAKAVKPAIEHLFGVPGASRASAYRAMRTELRDRLPSAPGPLVSIDGSLAHATSAVAWVSVPHRPRSEGRSHYNTARLAAHAMNVIASGSRSPLLFASVTGAICLGVAVIGAIAALATMAATASLGPAPWLAACAGLAVAGVLLVAVGILGELVARLLVLASGRPAYAVSDTTEPPG